MPFDSQPVLRGALVDARPLAAEDFEELYAVAADPLIWEQHPASNRWQPAVFRDFFDESLESRGALIVSDAATGRVIGSSRYFDYREADREVEIGWTFLARTHWGGRYNGELKRLMLDHAFRFLDSVVFLVGPNNVRSQRALEQIAARREGEPDSRGRVVFRITASDYGSAPGKAPR